MMNKKQKKLDKSKKMYLVTIALSVIVHLLFLAFFNFDYLLFDFDNENTELPEEVTIVFPENKPKQPPRQIVENLNENEEVPEESNLLSDRNSRAANPEQGDMTGMQPRSDGNTPFENLTSASQSAAQSKFLPSKKFNKDALRKSTTGEGEENFFKLPENEEERDSTAGNAESTINQ